MRIQCIITLSKKDVLEGLQDSVDARIPENADLEMKDGYLIISYDTAEM